MDGWLKDVAQIDEQAELLTVKRIAQRVRARAARRQAIGRALGSSSALALAVVAAVGLYLVDRRPSTVDGPQLASSAIPHSSSAIPVTLEKVDHSVAVAWEGSDDAEYVVYRCSSPRFDTCSLADEVKGTQWLDANGEAGTITFYRVEKKA